MHTKQIFYDLIERLETSFDELEKCISVTIKALEQKRAPEDLIERVHGYTGCVLKNRQQVVELRCVIQNNTGDCLDVNSITQLVKKINAVTVMVSNDAEELLKIKKVNDEGYVN